MPKDEYKIYQSEFYFNDKSKKAEVVILTILISYRSLLYGWSSCIFPHQHKVSVQSQNDDFFSIQADSLYLKDWHNTIFHFQHLTLWQTVNFSKYIYTMDYVMCKHITQSSKWIGFFCTVSDYPTSFLSLNHV